MHLSASAIALRRLMRANALLLEIVSGLYDQQASRWTAPTAPSAKWHLWHVARWSDIVQSTLFPIANNESDLANKGTDYSPDKSSRAMVVLMSVNTLSLVTATFVGGIVAEYFGNLSTFYGASGMGFAGAMLLLIAPEPRIAKTARYSLLTLVNVIKTPLLLRVAAIAITLQFVTFGVNFGFLPIHA
jgi:hypothetical protein